MKKEKYISPSLRKVAIDNATLLAASSESFNNGGGADPSTGRSKDYTGFDF